MVNYPPWFYFANSHSLFHPQFPFLHILKFKFPLSLTHDTRQSGKLGKIFWLWHIRLSRVINVSRFEIHHWIQVDFISYIRALSSVRHGVVSRKWKCIFRRRREGEVYLPDSAWNVEWSSGYDKYRLNNWWSEWKIWNLDWLNYYRVGKIANKFQFMHWALAMRKIFRAFPHR